MGVMIVSFALSACDRKTEDAPAGVLASSEARERGRMLYRQYCALCHGIEADGIGARRTGLAGTPVSFRSTTWRSEATPARVFSSIRRGVPPSSMPAWPSLSDDQTWALVAYVLSVSEEGP
jgi:high-affinity iron transporter